MQDMRTQQKMMEVAQSLETREAEQLSQFSKTLFEAVKGFETQRIENVKAAASAQFYEDQAAVQQAEADHDAVMGIIKNNSDQDAEAAATAFQTGMPYEVVRRFRSLSGHARAAYAEEMALNAGALYEQYQDEQLSSNESTVVIGGKEVAINKPEGLAEFSGVRAHTREQFIKELGIHNMTPGLQAKAFKLMYEVDAKLDNAYETEYNKEKGFNDRELFVEQWKDGVITTQQLITSLKATPGVNGTGTYTFQEIHKKIVEEAAELSIKDPQRAYALMEAYGDLELNGRKFKDIHGDKINQYIELAENYRNKEYQREEREAKRQLKDYVAQAQKQGVGKDFTLKDQENVVKGYIQLAASLGQPAIVPRELMELWTNFSAGAERIEQLMDIQENRKRAFALDPEEIKKLPQQVQDKYLKEAEVQAKARLGNLKVYNDSLKELVNKHPLVATTAGLEGRDIAPLIIADLQAELTADVVNGLRDNPQADAGTLARDSLNRLRGEFNAGIEDPNSQFYIGGKDSAQVFPKYFGETTPADVISKQLGYAKKEQFLVNRVAREGITVLDDKLLIADSLAQLQEQRKNYTRTGVLPQAAVSLARKFNWDPFEVFNRQLKGNNLDAIETFRDVQMKATDTFNTLKMLTRGQGNQQMLQRLTNDRWPVRSSLAQYVPEKGGLVGLTEQDFIDLAYAVSGEAARDTEDEYAVAASILNRVADPQFKESTVREVITADRQYEAYARGTMRHEPKLVQKLMSPEGQRRIIGMLHRLQGRTDFKGTTQRHNMGPGDVLADPNGNFFHYAGQTVGSGPYTGEIPRHYMKFISNE